MHEPGYLYLMINPSMEGMVKIGRTKLTPEQRAKELSAATGVPTPLQVVYEQYFSDVVEAEARVHALLEFRNFRVSVSREFFLAPTKVAIDAVLRAKSMCGSSGDCEDQGTPDIDTPYSQDKEEITHSNPWDEVMDLADKAYYGLDDTLEDHDEALKLYKQAARIGSGVACQMAGDILIFDFDETAEALGFYKLGAMRGIDECWAEMAFIYALKDHKDNSNKCWRRYFKSRSYIQDKGEDEWNSKVYHAALYVRLVCSGKCSFDNGEALTRIRDAVVRDLKNRIEPFVNRGSEENVMAVDRALRAMRDHAFALWALYPEARRQPQHGYIKQLDHLFGGGDQGFIFNEEGWQFCFYYSNVVEGIISYEELLVGMEVEFDPVEAEGYDDRLAANVRILRHSPPRMP